MTSPTNKVPRLFRVALPVTNIEKAASFYSRVLAIAGERVSKNRHYFDCGGTILACVVPDGKEDGPETPNKEYLYFVVPDIEAVHKRAKDAGCRSLDEVETQHWGERAFFAEDPFGNPLSFIDETTLFTGTRPRG